MPIDKLNIPLSGSIDQPTGIAFRSLQQQLDKLVDQLNNASTSSAPLSAGAALTLTSANAGRTILLDQASGSTVTLPAATGSGDTYPFRVSEVSSGHVIQVASASDIIQGVIFTVSDNSNAALGWRTADDTNTITLNGATQGGLEKGETITLLDAATGLWLVNGFTASNGSEQTPFSAV